MKKIPYFILAVSFIAGAAGCGDNKTNEKLVGTSIVSSGGVATGTGNLETTGGISQAMALGASVGTKAGGNSQYAGYAPYRPAIPQKVLGSNLGTPDSDGYYTVSGYGFSNTTVKIRFQDAAGNGLTLGPSMASFVKLHILITTRYSFGQFNGDFLILPDVTSSGFETLESGTIVTADPVGGTFTATIANMTLQRTTINSVPIGIPINGTMSISGTAGGHAYTGTNTFSKVGAEYRCQGPILVNQLKVADVFLTFDQTAGNYTGYWTDAVTNDGIQNAIQ